MQPLGTEASRCVLSAAEAAAQGRVYVSRERRLHDLPSVFSLEQLAGLLAQEKGAASVYVVRWERQGLIARAGERVGVYFNLTKPEGSRHALLASALQLRYPQIVERGLSVLRDSGWHVCTGTQAGTTVPGLSVAVPSSGSSQAKWTGVEVLARPKGWFDALAPWIEPAQGRGLPRLAPAAALADLCRGRSEQQPVPLGHLDLAAVDWIDVARAFKALGQRLPLDYAGFVAKDQVKWQLDAAPKPLAVTAA